MKLFKLSLGLATLALGIASAASSYKISIPADTWAGDTQIKAGDYKVTVTGNQATFTMGKQTVQVPASIENNTSKFSDTMLEATGNKLQAIDLGGTSTKIVFKSAKAGAVATQ
ncbi:MAG TPA: hypothetical protein VGG72_31830 [Bryobacteraceae bacterium]|jgi:hypothetical protein